MLHASLCVFHHSHSVEAHTHIIGCTHTYTHTHTQRNVHLNAASLGVSHSKACEYHKPPQRRPTWWCPTHTHTHILRATLFVCLRRHQRPRSGSRPEHKILVVESKEPLVETERRERTGAIV